MGDEKCLTKRQLVAALFSHSEFVKLPNERMTDNLIFYPLLRWGIKC